MAAKKSTINYAAKQAYQLCLMRGRTSWTIAGLECEVIHPNVYVLDTSEGFGKAIVHEIPIRKTWASL
jgi:hypothetical protein